MYYVRISGASRRREAGYKQFCMGEEAERMQLPYIGVLSNLLCVVKVDTYSNCLWWRIAFIGVAYRRVLLYYYVLLSRRNSTDTLYEVSRALQSASIVDIHRTGYILRR